MRRIRKSALLTAGLGVGLLASGAGMVRAENVPAPPETLTATFTQPEGGITTNLYWGKVLLNVSGVGQAYGGTHNDAFYLYDGPFSTPQNGHDGTYYQLTMGANRPLWAFDQSCNANRFLVGPLPAYNPDHEYTFMLDTLLETPGQLHFGVSDGGYSDNTGEYTITVTQLIADESGDWVPAPTRNIAGEDAAHAPEPGTMALLGLGVLPLLRRRRHSA